MRLGACDVCSAGGETILALLEPFVRLLGVADDKHMLVRTARKTIEPLLEGEDDGDGDGDCDGEEDEQMKEPPLPDCLEQVLCCNPRLS